MLVAQVVELWPIFSRVLAIEFAPVTLVARNRCPVDKC